MATRDHTAGGGEITPSPRTLTNAVVGQDGVDLIGHGLEHVLQELPGRLSISSCNELGDGELGRSVDANEEKELALGSLNLGYIDVKE